MTNPNIWERIFDELMFELTQLGASCTHKWDPNKTLEFELNQKKYRVEITSEVNYHYRKKYVKITVKDNDEAEGHSYMVLSKHELYQKLGII